MEQKEVKTVVAAISPLEAHLLLLLRGYGFGEFTVTDTTSDGKRRIRIRKKYGNPYQVVMEIQTNLDEAEGLKLPDSFAVVGDPKLLQHLSSELVNKIKREENVVTS